MNPLYQTKTIILNQGDPEEKRMEILQYFQKTFDLDEKLYESLADKNAVYLRADPLRHPLIFYYGHIAAFLINKLLLARLISDRINPQFESLFAVGVDEMSWDHLEMNHYEWPSYEEVAQYRQQVREVVEKVIRTAPLSMPIDWENPFWIIMMGIEHARIHIETSSLLIRQLPLHYLKPIKDWKVCPERGKAPDNELIPVEEGEVSLGKAKDYSLYGWDNEYGHHHKFIQGFKAARFLVTNKEFEAFVKDGGYHQKRWWTKEGWSWKTFRQAERPLFWRVKEKGLTLRLMAQEIPMPWNWPVEANFHEAKAFCNWKSQKTGSLLRLPTEEEWFLMYSRADIPDQPYWEMAPGNLNMEHFQSPCPVDKFSFGPFYDLVGNVWQWTETLFSGFKNFSVHPYYDDFSTPTFDNKHNVIKGGSWISTGNEATRYARYAFRRHFFQHAGFRYVESSLKPSAPLQTYESDAEIACLCEGHYGDGPLPVPNYHVDVAAFCLEFQKQYHLFRVLDLGCSVGRASWELTKGFEEVTGLDFTARTIRVGQTLTEVGSLKYQFPEEGELTSFKEVSLERLGLIKGKERISFFQADPSNLKMRFKDYDLILVNRVLNQMADPRAFLEKVHKRLNPGGFLVVSFSTRWDESITSRDQWLGGRRVNGEPKYTKDAVEEVLAEKFDLVEDAGQIPFMVPINRSNYYLSMTNLMAWRLK